MEEEKKEQEKVVETSEETESEKIDINEGFDAQEESIDSKISNEIIDINDERALEKGDEKYNSDSIQVLEGLEAVRKRCKKKTWYVYWIYIFYWSSSFSVGNRR